MGSNWGEYSIAEIIELVIDNRGRNPSSYSDFGIPVIDNYLITSKGEPELSNVKRYITKDIYDSFIRKYNQTGDVLLTLVGNGYGKVAISPKEQCIIIQNTIGLRTKTGFDNNFLYYLLKGNRKSLTNLNRGAAQPSIKVGDVLDLCFNFPSFEQQKAIGEMLNQLDKKIQINKQTNQTLEKMAQTLFKSWFVDFDPVFDNLLATVDFKLENLPSDFPDALLKRAEKRLLALDDAAKSALLSTTVSSKNLLSKNKSLENKPSENRAPTNIHQHFPNEFEYNEQLGWIPKGWMLKSIDELCIVNPQSWTKKNAPEVVKYVDLANAKNGVIGEIVEYIFSEAPSRARRVLQPHDIIIGVVRPANRSFAYVNDEGLTGSTGFAVIRAMNTNYRAFSYLSLTNDDCIQEFARIADGAAYPAIKPEDVAKASCIFSNDIILEKFEELVGEFMKKKSANERQLVPLTKLRDTLLSKLISGELQIPDVEMPDDGTATATS